MPFLSWTRLVPEVKGDDVSLVWVEGVPPELEQRVIECIARSKAAIRTMDANPDCPIALAAIRSAATEGENVKALLQEWRVEEAA